MAWFSYILLSVPEAFILTLFVFVLFGISVKDYLKRLILFAFVYGGCTFLLSMFFDTSFKPFLTFSMFFLSLVFIFRFKLLQSALLALSAFVTLGLMEILITLFLIHVFPINLNYAEILSNPWTRIVFGYLTALLPLLLVTYLLFRLRIKINITKLILR